MVEPEEADEDLKEEVTEECSKFGPVERVRLHVVEDVLIFVQFAGTESAAKALESMNGRWFGYRQVHADYCDPERFIRGDFDIQ
jgi:RNA recognition motif-containing protein